MRTRKGTTSKVEDAVANAEHYKALGIDEVYLSDDEGPFPWEFVTSCRPGGSHRLEISTDVWFTAEHPCGMSFRWTFEIEPYSANGSGHYQIDVDKIAAALKRLPEKAAAEFRVYLAECADAVGKKGDEWQKICDSQRETERRLRKAAR